MSKEAQDELSRLIEAERERDSQFDYKVAYWNALEQRHNKTGQSLMQLNETKEGEAIANEICRKISADMIAKFGE